MVSTLFFFSFFLSTVSLLHADPSLQPFIFPTTPPTIIPAFPEQSDIAGSCPLDLPDELFSAVSRSCSAPAARFRCCPTLAAWLYSAYSSSALAVHLPSAAADLPVLPDDSESCVDGVEKALGARGVALPRVNDTCDVVYCYCGVRLRPFNCNGGIAVAKENGKWVAKDSNARRIERDCAKTGINGCSRCLTSLYKIKEGTVSGNKTGSAGEGGWRRKKTESERHKRDCQLMGLTWLLAKNRTLYLPTVTKVLRAFMMTPNGMDPISCTLARDGIPLAVDSAEFDENASSSSASLLTTVGSSLFWSCIRWICCGLLVLVFPVV